MSQGAIWNAEGLKAPPTHFKIGQCWSRGGSPPLAHWGMERTPGQALCVKDLQSLAGGMLPHSPFSPSPLSLFSGHMEQTAVKLMNVHLNHCGKRKKYIYFGFQQLKKNKKKTETSECCTTYSTGVVNPFLQYTTQTAT